MGACCFEPFDLTILYGERVGIVGANGSGKTTLLKTMLELLPATRLGEDRGERRAGLLRPGAGNPAIRQHAA